MSTKKYKVGDTLYRVGRHRPPIEITIDRIGRKWIYAGREKIDPETLYVEIEGYGTVAKCYQDQATYEAIKTRQVEWEKLQKATRDRYAPPTHLTTEQVTSLRQLIEGNAP